MTCFSETNGKLVATGPITVADTRDSVLSSVLVRTIQQTPKIRYVNEMPQFRLSDFVRNENHDKLKDMFFTKSSAWAYEKEWRVLHAEAGTLFTYEREALKAIYFGPDIESQDPFAVCCSIVPESRTPNFG